MKLLKFIFTVLWGLGYLGNGILFISIEWSFLEQNFIQIFNPYLHLQVFGVLLTARLFWVFLAMAVIGSYAVSITERHLAQVAEQTKIDAAKTVYQSPQTFPERKPKHSSPSTGSEQNYSNYRNQPPQTFPKSANKVETESVEPQVKLLEWAIQSSQKVRFSYETRDGEKSERTVTPVSFKTVKQTLCLEGYCYLRSAKRHFALKRMRDIEIVCASQVNYSPVISDVITLPNVPEKVSLVSQIPLPKVTQTKNNQVKQRLYINYRTNELETIATSEWDNTEVLNQIHYELEFRSRKKALDLRKCIATRLTQLEETQFNWSTTEANSGLHNLSTDAFKYEEGLLKHYGYKVGMSGLSQRERWEILDTVFLQPLLINIDNVAYLKEWGEPKSARRLKKIVDSIATFTRNAKRRNQSSFSKAIEDWETDLTYLKRNYYDNRFSFQYPRT
ncbi:WYL domain-containing protein [Plectonema cf. radiosum LEGE 06105]|uniref:WYL domain-containing protein n=1 Tax=Plectonema cf. radiosum LEGE 06105 TaxID=945769 RepID=A0A8J7JZU5_9CYAN|nr:WYL domain-containing protein [Plectonema radiosum]MBE9212911.1 WYL domain-containing protein [Plectonema cf. radiosum LEGE 06105]